MKEEALTQAAQDAPRYAEDRSRMLVDRRIWRTVGLELHVGPEMPIPGVAACVRIVTYILPGHVSPPGQVGTLETARAAGDVLEAPAIVPDHQVRAIREAWEGRPEHADRVIRSIWDRAISTTALELADLVMNHPKGPATSELENARLRALIRDIRESVDGGETAAEDLPRLIATLGRQWARVVSDTADRKNAAVELLGGGKDGEIPADPRGLYVRLKSGGPDMSVLAVRDGWISTTWPGEVTVDDTVRPSADGTGTTTMSIDCPAFYGIFDARTLDRVEY